MKTEYQMTDREYFASIGKSKEASQEWKALDLDGEGGMVEFDWTDEFDCNAE